MINLYLIIIQYILWIKYLSKNDPVYFNFKGDNLLEYLTLTMTDYITFNLTEYTY